MSASLLIPPFPTFLDANGKPLAGGLIYTYAAGTTTPQAAYTDAAGSTALPNPVVLDSAGRASIWLGAQTYKLVCQNSSGVTQWTADNVSSVSLAELQAASTFASLTVEGSAAIDGDLTVDGSATCASQTVTGTSNLEGAVTAQSLAVTANQTIGGTLGVTGATTLAALTAAAATVSSLTIGSTSLTSFIEALLPSIATVTTRSDTGYFIVRIPLASGNLEIGFGSGAVANGGFIPLPSGFSYSNMAAIVSPHDIRANTSNNSDAIALEQNAVNGDGSVTLYQQGTSGNRWPVGGSPTTQSANWLAVIWRTF
jgi:hypothetical protein